MLPRAVLNIQHQLNILATKNQQSSEQWVQCTAPLLGRRRVQRPSLRKSRSSETWPETRVSPLTSSTAGSATRMSTLLATIWWVGGPLGGGLQAQDSLLPDYCPRIFPWSISGQIMEILNEQYAGTHQLPLCSGSRACRCCHCCWKKSDQVQVSKAGRRILHRICITKWVTKYCKTGRITFPFLWIYSGYQWFSFLYTYLLLNVNDFQTIQGWRQGWGGLHLRQLHELQQ